MKTIALFVLLSFASLANSQFIFSGGLSAQANGDDPSASGFVRVRTEYSDVLYFESSLVNSIEVTGVHLHLSPGGGSVFGGPLILALTNTSTAPVSSTSAGPLIQNGAKNTTELLANGMLPAVRAKLQELGITDNNVGNIGDVDRLLRSGVVYSDVHTVQRVSPNGLIRGTIYYIPAAPTPAPTSGNSGRKLQAI